MQKKAKSSKRNQLMSGHTVLQQNLQKPSQAVHERNLKLRHVMRNTFIIMKRWTIGLLKVLIKEIISL